MERIEFYSKNKFEKLVHLVGFIIRIQTTFNAVQSFASKWGIVQRAVSSLLILLQRGSLPAVQ